MEPLSSSAAPTKISSKVNFTLKSGESSYDFTIINKEKELTFKLEDLKEFPIKIYELNIDLEKLRQLDENFFMFKNSEKIIKTINTCIENEKYSINFDKEENVAIFEIKNELFENGGAKIKIPEKEQDLKSQVEALTKTVSELRKEIQNIKIKKLEKEQEAIKSFEQTSFLNEDEKILISKWIHPDKVIKFNMIFNTAKDGDSASTFHYYCDWVYPTVTVVLDTEGRKFGGYATNAWCQPSAGSVTSRAPDSFLFNLTNQKKFGLKNNFDSNAI